MKKIKNKMLSSKKIYWIMNKWFYRLANLNSLETMGKDEKFINRLY